MFLINLFYLEEKNYTYLFIVSFVYLFIPGGEQKITC